MEEVEERREGEVLGPGEDSRETLGENDVSYGERERRRCSMAESLEPSVEAAELGVVGREIYVSDLARMRPLRPIIGVSN